MCREKVLDKNRFFLINKNMRRITAIASFLAFLLTVLLIHVPVFAQDLKDVLTKQYREGKDICTVTEKAIRSGMNAKEVTKACIEMGHDACLVVRCAVEANGSIEQIITGALEAGATSDVCSRCAMNAGADPRDVAKILETGLGYSPIPGGGLSPIEVGLPGGNRGSGVMSSSSFR